MLTESDLEKRQKLASKLFKRLRGESNLWCRKILAQVALQYNARYSTGYYSSPEIEKVYTDIAETVNTPLSGEYEKGTCLIVTTRTYNMGGHTRVIERWIEADTSHKYSLLLTNHNDSCVPPRLVEAIRGNGGDIISVYGEGSVCSRGKKLREISLKYESVLLFLLEEDVVPLIAYGTTAFTRPVGLYNHIDHLYWTGVSIADYVADIRPWGYEVSHNNRGIQNSMIVPVPVETQDRVEYLEKTELRIRLGLPKEAYIIVTCGREVKYKTSAQGSFLDIVSPILRTMPDVVIVAIGMSFDDFPDWKDVASRYVDRFHLIKRVPHAELKKYYHAADIVLDSFPAGGITALEDAVHCGCPILSCSKSIDWVFASPSYCNNKDELVLRVHDLHENHVAAYELWEKTKVIMEKMAGINIFTRQVNIFMENLVKLNHMVRDFVASPTHFIQNDFMREDQILNATRKPEFLAQMGVKRPTWLWAFIIIILQNVLKDVKCLARYFKRT